MLSDENIYFFGNVELLNSYTYNFLYRDKKKTREKNLITNDTKEYLFFAATQH